MEGNLPSKDCRDATELICGLITELSSLKLVIFVFHFVLNDVFLLPLYLYFLSLFLYSSSWSSFFFNHCNNLDSCFLIDKYL